MASIIEICNQGLYNLGQPAITALTDNSEAARLCNGRFVYIRDATLRAYPWNCAVRRSELARSSTTPSWGYDYQYALPTNPLCLRVLTIKESYDWKVEGQFILTDSDECNIKYIAQLTDPNNMDILLREAIAGRLAAEICYPLTGSTKQQAAMWEIYKLKLREAKSIDAQEGNPESLIDDTFLNARL